MSRTVLLSILTLAFYSLSDSAGGGLAFASGRIRVVEISGSLAPGGTELFRSFGEPALNDLGQVAYRARLSTLTGQNTGEYGIYLGDGASSTTIVRSDQLGPGGSDTFTDFSSVIPAINNRGQVGFIADLVTAGGRAAAGIFLGDGATIDHIAVEGGTAPGGDGDLYANLHDYVLNNNGDTVFKADFPGLTPNRMLLATPTSTSEIARRGVESYDGNGLIGSFRGYAINDQRQIAMAYDIIGSSYSRIYRFDNGIPTKIASTGDASPDGRGAIGRLLTVNLNELGQVAFPAGIEDTLGAQALYIGDGQSLVAVAGTGQAVPEGNGTFSAFYDVHFNNASQLASVITLSGPSVSSANDVGIYRFDGDNVRQIAREGQVTPSGRAVFTDLTEGIQRGIAFNELGQIAFEAELSWPYFRTRGLFVSSPTGSLYEIASTQDPLLGSRISDLNFSGGLKQSSGLNNVGEVAFQFNLADGRSGIAIWSIPEPSSVSLVAYGAAAILGSMRTRWRDCCSPSG